MLRNGRQETSSVIVQERYQSPPPQARDGLETPASETRHPCSGARKGRCFSFSS